MRHKISHTFHINFRFNIRAGYKILVKLGSSLFLYNSSFSVGLSYYISQDKIIVLTASLVKTLYILLYIFYSPLTDSTLILSYIFYNFPANARGDGFSYLALRRDHTIENSKNFFRQAPLNSRTSFNSRMSRG